MDETQTQTQTPTQTVEHTPSDCNYVFSMRIVSIDFYMAPPIPNVDISYSSFHGEKVNEVPVIRIYGSTPAGQKTCLHVHKALPYLYVPCADIPLQSRSEGDVYTHAISLALEKALKLKGNAAVKRQHVHGCSVVRARRFYGYHASEELFVKIYLYNPNDVSRAAKLLLGGAVFDRSVQPHESHIPYLLQFLIDYNLYGMGLLHLLKIKFRCPFPDSFASKGSSNDDRARAGVDDLDNVSAPSQIPIWTSSTIPGDWRWQYSSDSHGSVDEDVNGVKRQSICELEGDAVVEDVINQQFKSYTSLSQTLSDVKMVQSLVPIWEEFEKAEIHGVSIHPDPGRPSAEDVLKCLSCGLDYGVRLEKLISEPKKILSPSEQNLMLLGSLTSLEDGRNKQGGELIEPFEIKASISSVSAEEPPVEGRMHGSAEVGKHVYFELQPDERRPSQLTKTSQKAVDKEALGILKWLASSQVMEDINSDDELVREIILSPLLPANTMDKVLEKANMDYDNESQRECQDILDSIEDTNEFEDLKDASYAYLRNSADALSKRILPQLDGSSDLPSSPHSGTAETSSKAHKKRKIKGSVWGSLPFTMNLKESEPEFVDSKSFDMNLGGATTSKGHSCASHSANLSNIGENNAGSSGPRAESNISYSGEASTSEELSVRDLMRKKRCCRLMPPEVSCLNFAPPRTSRKEEVNVFSYPEDTAFNKSSDDDQKELNDVYKKLPFSSSSLDGTIGNSFQASSEVHGALSYAAKCDDESDAAGLVVDTASGEPGIRMTWVSPAENASPRSSEIKSSSLSLDLHEACREEWPSDDSKLITSDRTSDKLIQLERGACLGNSLGDGGTLFACCNAMSHADYEDNEKRNDTKSSQDFNRGDHTSEKTAGLSGAAILEPTVSVDKPLHLVDPSCKKAPLVDQKIEASRNVPFVEARSSSISLAEERALDEVPPDFQRGIQEASEMKNNNAGGDSTVCQEALTNVPTHYLNDGSILYLLKPAISPPTVDAVANWLSLELEGESGNAVGAQRISLDDVDRVVPDSSSSDVKNSIDIVELDSRNSGAEISSSHGERTKILSKDNSPKLKPCSNVFQDISQISGPDGKSGSTPLSQLGFRDPASVGAGQQLTVLSIEVQAECRGDLRPDPRFDGIDVAALTVVRDIGLTAEHYLLLHCKNENESNSRNYDGLSSCKVLVFLEEKDLFLHFVKIVSNCDPDILVGWDVQSGSLGFMAERASYLGIGLLSMMSRTPSESKIAFKDSENADKEVNYNAPPEVLGEDSIIKEAIIEDEWGRTHASGIHVGGRIVLNVWRLMRGEIKLTMYTAEAVAEAVLRRKIPSIPHKILTKWFRGHGRARYRCLLYVMERSKLNLQIMNQLDLVNRTSELARVFGIDFFSVLSRGSQYRVESMFLRLAHTQNYIAISPGNQQVASQPAMECLPLVMEPESGFYADPVVVLDFQSLYPSMIIAYNLCFSTCLGKVIPSKENTLGVASFSPDLQVLRNLRDQLLLTPNGVMYVPPKICKGVLPRLLEEILSTRIMVKQAMKKLTPSQIVLHRIFNARQLALKLIANVTYGYTAAGFSGRMPCAELADSIVQCGRRTLESAISFVNAHDKWNARVIYGDTDSMFVLLRGRTMKEAFQVGNEIASAISAMNPNPVALKMEKVYHPCFLLTKKRYVGYSYESPDQTEPLFDAKGIETVRRDTCNAVAKSMEQSLRLYFECQDTSEVKAYLYRQWTKILSGRVSLQDFIFAKEVRLGTYSTRPSSSLPPAAIVASKAMRVDPRAEPRYGERVPYIVVHGQPGARLVDMVVDPLEVLALDSPYRVNELYYITKQIIPALQRVFGLVGVDLYRWFSEMPRPIRENFAKHPVNGLNPQRKRIDYYYLSKHCIVCGDLVLASAYICEKCSRKSDAVTTVVTGKTSKLEREMQHLAAICQHCGGGDWLLETGVKCTSLACPVFYERRKVQKELQSLSAVATEIGLYPKCMVEWF